jgi:hypothetical protein
MKQRDARIFALCQHLRSAIDILEQIASQPYQPPHAARRCGISIGTAGYQFASA